MNACKSYSDSFCHTVCRPDIVVFFSLIGRMSDNGLELTILS